MTHNSFDKSDVRAAVPTVLRALLAMPRSREGVGVECT